MTHNKILSGFKTTGLYPFNPQAIPKTALAPSILAEATAPFLSISCINMVQHVQCMTMQREQCSLVLKEVWACLMLPSTFNV